MPHRFTDRWLASVTFGAQWEEFTSLHHAADWLAAHGVRVSASTLYAMYYRHRWEGTERATGRNIMCHGVIVDTNVDAATKRQIWGVKYDDRSKEDFDEDELVRYAIKYVDGDSVKPMESCSTMRDDQNGKQQVLSFVDR